MLEQDVVIELIAKAQKGDLEAKSELLTHNSPLIKSVIRHYKNKGIENDDLYQLGCIGFLKAINNFQSEFKVKFSTYAVPMIAGEVKRFIRDDGYIKVSRSTKTLATRINYFVESYKRANNESPSLEIIAKEFQIDEQEVVFAMDSSKFPISLYEKYDDESSLSLIDKVASKDESDDNIDKIILKDLINNLEEREKKIIILRYFRDKTQSEVANVLKVSQVQISRLESKIIEKFKTGFVGKNI